MTQLYKTAATLRFFGDDLDPEEITQLLGSKPTIGAKKGGSWLTSKGAEKTANTGQWRLSVERQMPGNLDRQVAELLLHLTIDLDVWAQLTGKFEANIFCGLFLQESNEGLSLSPQTTLSIGQRGLTLDFDIYGAEPDHL